MAMQIFVEECLRCGACMLVCPRQAIEENATSDGETIYTVAADRCTGCADEGAPQCREDCPVPECLMLD